MEFITIEQIKEAGNDVFDQIMKWWEPSPGDVIRTCEGKRLLIDHIEEDKVFFCNDSICSTWDYKGNIVPFLTVQQLISFIEWRTEYNIEKIEYGVVDCYWIHPYFEETYGMDEDVPRWISNESSFCDEKLINALWKCACEVATDSYYD